MQKSLTQIFNESAAAAHEAFPAQLKNLVILSTASETPVYISPEIADHLSRNVAAVKKAVEERTNYLHTHNAAGVASPCYPLAGISVKLIAIGENIKGVFSSRYTKEMRSISILDHEIGHHTVKNGSPFLASASDCHLAECAADAFAALRHIQRFGKDTEFFEYNTRASSIVLGLSPIHYTAEALQKAKQLAEEMDISCLSLHKTAELAEKIATECRLDIKTLEKLCNAFQPVADACKAHIGSKQAISDKLPQQDKDAYALFCRETLSVMRKHRNDADIFKAGKRFLNSPLIKKFMQKQAEFADALASMEKPAPQKKVAPCRNP